VVIVNHIGVAIQAGEFCAVDGGFKFLDGDLTLAFIAVRSMALDTVFGRIFRRGVGCPGVAGDQHADDQRNRHGVATDELDYASIHF
jgi:hypothetical protein